MNVFPPWSVGKISTDHQYLHLLYVQSAGCRLKRHFTTHTNAPKCSTSMGKNRNFLVGDISPHIHPLDAFEDSSISAFSQREIQTMRPHITLECDSSQHATVHTSV